MKLFLLLCILGVLTSCNASQKGDAVPVSTVSTTPLKSSYFSFQNGKEYSIGDTSKTIILDFVATEGAPNIRYTIDNGAWYRISDGNCSAFRVHIVIEKGRMCKIMNDTNLYVAGHYEHTSI